MKLNKNNKVVKKEIEVEETTYTLELTKEQLCLLCSFSGYVSGVNRFRDTFTDVIYEFTKGLSKNPNNFCNLFLESIDFRFDNKDLIETADKISKVIE